MDYEKPTNQSKPVILVVNDNPLNIQMLKNQLSLVDCNLATAMNENQVLQLIETVKPDLILLDFEVSAKKEYMLCRMLNSGERIKNIPLIVFSDEQEIENIEKSVGPGTVDCISRPFGKYELVTRINYLLAMKRKKEDLEKELKKKNLFFSIISHELRGSFGIVLNFVDMLKNEGDNMSAGQKKEVLNDIEGITQNTMGLLENLLRWSNVQYGEIFYNPEDLELNNLINETIEDFTQAACRKNIRLVSNVGSLSVSADRNMVQLILRNLLTNALKFTPCGGNITVGSIYKGGSVKIQISDSGLGMNPDKVEQLFRIDRKVTTPGTENEQGSGLGLIFCREFLRCHGSDIGIESVPGKGTTVWFMLPLAVMQHAEV